ncbi:hypothetical protein [Sphaerisporangium perillae]|uniref:hypothetical protein n=1 Tax=Sphaerisporangium perillae TaxID=2935860 RepID=UPI00200E4B1C|nr:hypothetical protein [Sphaerisporangium perillae]
MATPPGLVPDAPPLPPGPPEAPRRHVPAWRRAAGALLGLVLAAGAVYVQTRVLTADQLDDPLTVSGGMHDELETDLFSARLERVEFARSVRVKKQFSTDEATTEHVFLIVKMGATSRRKPVQLTAHLITAGGLSFDPTDRVDARATMADKWVQPGWWRSGLYFFEIPPDKAAGSRVVLSEPKTLFGDAFIPETSSDLGLDEAKARQMIDAAKDVYEVSG